MSASQEKKLRKQLREEGKDKRLLAQKKAETAHKRTRLVEWLVGVVVALAVIALVILNSTLLYSNFTAVKVGDTSYTAAEFSFFYKTNYISFVNQNSSYLSLLGLDTSKSLSSQEAFDGGTWADYFRTQAQSMMKEITAFNDEAAKEGFTLSEEDQTALDSAIESYKTAYQSTDYTSADAYLASIYGKGCTVEVISKLLEKRFIHDAYSQSKQNSFTYTDSELKDYYAENKDNLDKYSYISYYADGAVAGDSTDDTDEAATEAAKTAAMADAKTKAESIVADGKTEDAFKDAVQSESGSEASVSSTQGSSLSSSYADWLKDSSRRSGDTTVIESDTGYYALYYIARDDNDYDTINVRHILVKAVADDDGTYSADAKATAKSSAQDLLDEWEAGDATEDSFAALANANSEDTGSNTTGGLYENVTKGTMVEEFNNWCFDSVRKPGDTGIVYGESSSYAGYHVMYFVGKGENEADLLAKNGLLTADYTDWMDALLENYETTLGFTGKLVK